MNPNHGRHSLGLLHVKVPCRNYATALADRDKEYVLVETKRQNNPVGEVH